MSQKKIQQKEVNAPLKDLKSEAEWTNRKRKLEAGQQKLLEQAVFNMTNYGEEDYRTQFAMAFLDVSLQMKDVVEIMDGLRISMTYMGDCIDFIDASIDFTDMIFDGSLEHKYGFISRIKRYFKMKRAIRNNYRRIDGAISSITSSFKMAGYMVDSLSRSMGKLRFKMNKTKEKNRKKSEIDKRRGGSGTKGGSYVVSGDAASLVKAEIAKRGGEASGTSPAPSSSGGSSDISDITDI